jgi:hypothetical protein
MIEDMIPLDGNAAAGRLDQVFAFDATLAIITCRFCARAGPLAELQLYGREAGLVLRCRRCEAVNIRMLETDRDTNLDLSGVSRITIRKDEARQGLEQGSPAPADRL